MLTGRAAFGILALPILAAALYPPGAKLEQFEDEELLDMCRLYPAMSLCSFYQLAPVPDVEEVAEEPKGEVSKRKSAFVRFGKRSTGAEEEVKTEEKRKSAFVRFGKRKSSYVRFG